MNAHQYTMIRGTCLGLLVGILLMLGACFGPDRPPVATVAGPTAPPVAPPAGHTTQSALDAASGAANAVGTSAAPAAIALVARVDNADFTADVRWLGLLAIVGAAVGAGVWYEFGAALGGGVLIASGALFVASLMATALYPYRCAITICALVGGLLYFAFRHWAALKTLGETILHTGEVDAVKLSATAKSVYGRVAADAKAAAAKAVALVKKV